MLRDFGDPHPVPESLAVIRVLAKHKLFDSPFQYGAVVLRQPIGIAVAVSAKVVAFRALVGDDHCQRLRHFAR